MRKEERRLASTARHNAIVGMHKAQDPAGNLFDDVGIWTVRREQRHIALQPGAHGLKAFDLEL